MENKPTDKEVKPAPLTALQKAQVAYDELIKTDTSKMTDTEIKSHREKCTKALTAKREAAK